MDFTRLEIYDTSRFAYDPKDKNFVVKLNKIPEFRELDFGKDRQKYFVYIALMYDKHSDIRLNSDLNYWQKKKTAALASGFPLVEGRFKKEVEDNLLCKNKIMLDAIVRYLQFQYMPDYTQLCMYQMLNDIIWKKAVLDQETKLLKEATALTQLTADLEEKIFGGSELPSAKEALYQKVGAMDLGIKAEDVAKKLESNETLNGWSKFGEYIPDDIKFAGDEMQA